MLDAEPAGVLPAPVAGPPEHRLGAGVVAFGVEVEIVSAELVRPFVVPAGQRPRLFADVVLAVGAAVGAEREQLHHLAGVVLVGRLLGVFGAVQPLQHRRVDGDRPEEVEEGAEAGRAEEVRLVDHLLLAGDVGVGGREPVVEDERHPLDQRLVAAHHAVEEPEVVVAVGVGGGDRVVVVVDRGRPVQRRGAAGPGQRLDRADQPEAGQLLGLPRDRAEAGPFQQPLRLRRPEGPLVGARRAGVAVDRDGWRAAVRRPRPRTAVMAPLGLVLVADDIALHPPAALAVGDPAVVLVLPGMLMPAVSPPLRSRSARCRLGYCHAEGAALDLNEVVGVIPATLEENRRVLDVRPRRRVSPRFAPIYLAPGTDRRKIVC